MPLVHCQRTEDALQAMPGIQQIHLIHSFIFHHLSCYGEPIPAVLGIETFYRHRDILHSQTHSFTHWNMEKTCRLRTIHDQPMTFLLTIDGLISLTLLPSKWNKYDVIQGLKSSVKVNQVSWTKECEKVSHPTSLVLLGKDQMTIMWSMEPQWVCWPLLFHLPPFKTSTPWSLKGLHMFMAHACGMTMDSPYKSQQDHGVFQILLSEDSCWQNDSSHIYFGQSAGALSGKLIRKANPPPNPPIKNVQRANEKLLVMTFSYHGILSTFELCKG